MRAWKIEKNRDIGAQSSPCTLSSQLRSQLRSQQFSYFTASVLELLLVRHLIGFLPAVFVVQPENCS
jgi:hypothetical protein